MSLSPSQIVAPMQKDMGVSFLRGPPKWRGSFWRSFKPQKRETPKKSTPIELLSLWPKLGLGSHDLPMEFREVLSQRLRVAMPRQTRNALPHGTRSNCPVETTGLLSG